MLLCTMQAAYFSNIPYTLRQPNGDTLQCLITGDEFYHYLHDADGFTIVKNPQTGYYMYAEKVDGKVIPSRYVAGKVNPHSVGLAPGVRISAAEWQARRERMAVPVESPASQYRDETNHGTLNNLVIFIRFADDADFTQSPVIPYNMFNAPDNLSLYNYYKIASYNQLEIISHFFPTPTGTTILSYQDSHPRNYYCKWSEDNPDGYGEDNPDNSIYPRTEREMTLVANAIEYVRASIPTDIFDTNGIFVCVVRIAVRKSKVNRRAAVVPCDKEFFFDFGIESVTIDVVDAFPEFKQQAELHGVFLESVTDDNGKSKLSLDFAFAKDGHARGIFGNAENRDEQRNVRDWLVVAFGTCKFAVDEF